MSKRKTRTRRHRRRAKAQLRNPKSVRPHREQAGRTGAIHHKQLAGRLAEAKKRKPAAATVVMVDQVEEFTEQDFDDVMQRMHDAEAGGERR